jgi:hypothetical protein
MTADLPQICRSEGVEEIWSRKPAWGRVDDWKLPKRGGRQREHQKTSKTFIEGHRKVALIPC